MDRCSNAGYERGWEGRPVLPVRSMGVAGVLMDGRLVKPYFMESICGYFNNHYTLLENLSSTRT